ncbi:conserved hypothetical protein [Ricinus communis]|uniref:Uncharacterized protein n=1 Tax=Ricinus communis TaxID=3988 RepID=B9RS91_RICCO|nr:conserved hypothetical protein [Ricinus communis]
MSMLALESLPLPSSSTGLYLSADAKVITRGSTFDYWLEDCKTCMKRTLRHCHRILAQKNTHMIVELDHWLKDRRKSASVWK